MYVDSGSTDGSADRARQFGIDVVVLDPEEGFTAAKARNLGWRRVLELDSDAWGIQFIDGDCEITSKWIAQALAFLDTYQDVAAVCGRRRERYPESSPYNRLIDMEWDTPVGEAESCGGDAMMRVAALKEVGGFNPKVVAGEEPELCYRLRRAGWKIYRIDSDMTLHDAAITQARQWYRRQLRGGYGAYQVWKLIRVDMSHPFAKMSRSTVRWTLGWLGLTIVCITLGVSVAGAVGATIGMSVAILVWVGQMVKIAFSGLRRGLAVRMSVLHGWMTMTGKWPQLVGLMKCWFDFRLGRMGHIIEYKEVGRRG